MAVFVKLCCMRINLLYGTSSVIAKIVFVRLGLVNKPRRPSGRDVG
jgi:hypothetical protein